MRLKVFAAIFAAVTFLSAPAFADEVHEPDYPVDDVLHPETDPAAIAADLLTAPDWNLIFPGAADSPLDIALKRGGCAGHANQPYEIAYENGKSGIGYSAYQNCTGDFFDQQVCVKLQQRRASGTWYQRTVFYCSPQTTAPHAYAGSAVTCKGAGHGTFRTKSKATVDTEYGVFTAHNTSEPATLC